MKHVPHLHIPRPWSDGPLRVSDEQIGHLQRVLRIEDGARVTYTDGAGFFGDGAWSDGRVERGEEQRRPRPTEMVMAVAPPSSRDRARFVVEKLSELGVESLLWLSTANGGRRLPSLKNQRAWAKSALEQSRGSWLMTVSGSLSTWEDLEPPVAVCVLGGGPPDLGMKVRTVAIGPEGGLDPDEVPGSAIRVGLGETILRVETAAVVAASKFQ